MVSPLVTVPPSFVSSVPLVNVPELAVKTPPMLSEGGLLEVLVASTPASSNAYGPETG
jgi:hypothetical protein